MQFSPDNWRMQREIERYKDETERYKGRCAVLELEIESLREQLQSVVKDVDMSAAMYFRLTRAEFLLLATLLQRDFCSDQTLMDALYSVGADDPPNITILKVFICKLRQKLKKHGIKISTQWGSGYFLAPEEKKKIREMLESLKEALS